MKSIIYILFISFSFSQHAPFFDGDKAYEYLLKQCDFGTRYPGSIEHIKLKDYFIDFLKDKGDTLIVDEHKIKHPYLDENINIYNLFVRFNVQSERRIMLMAHWDTREIADKDPDEKNHNHPIMGANDGASGIAVMMVIAELLNSYPMQNLGVDLLFVDAEDMGRSGDIENFSLGTKAFTKNIPYPLPQLAICIDMVADIDAEFKMEYFSLVQAENEVREIWNLANSMGYSEFSYKVQSPIYDDHRAFFVETGIPSLDIIDFDYPYWHTLEDTPDKCSAKTLGIVGTVVSEYLYLKDLR